MSGWPDRLRETYTRGASGEDIETLEDFWVYAGNLQSAFPEWRKGQSIYNALTRVRIDLSRQIDGTELDPFHNDGVVSALSVWLEAHWTDIQSVKLTEKERDALASAINIAYDNGYSSLSMIETYDLADKLWDMDFN
jgi:hypothetical protein